MLTVPVLAYHQVAPYRGPSPDRPGLVVHRTSFHRQLLLLRILGYRTITLDQLIKALEGGPALPRRAVALTFDDGYRGTYEWAFPLLLRYGFIATFFLIAEDFAIERNAMSKRAYSVLDSPQVREMISAGMQIGSHSVSHPRLCDLTPAQGYAEIVDSKALLECAFGQSIDAFCYPYGQYHARLVSLVEAAGYSCAVTTQFGQRHRVQDRFALKRIPVGAAQGLAQFAYRLLRDRE